jgi:hypothetical protein
MKNLILSLFLNQKQLAERWLMSERTLERWRCQGIGPAFVKLGGKVVYHLTDIEEFEKGNKRYSTSE